MSNTKLHNNSYKHCDPIPTPQNSLKQYNDFKESSPNTSTMSVKNVLIRSSSLDSLINSSEQDSSIDDELSDSDSLCELKNITSYDMNSVDKPRKSDIEHLKDVEPPKEPAIKAYLEQSHKTCDYENCGFKQKTTDNEKGGVDEITCQNIGKICSKAIVVSAPVVLKNNRRNSVASSESNRMETILEEPNDTKNLTVKEILARFETLRETAEVKRHQRSDTANFSFTENMIIFELFSSILLFKYISDSFQEPTTCIFGS